MAWKGTGTLYLSRVSFLVWSICCSVIMAFRERFFWLIFKKWGKTLCLRSVITQKWLEGKLNEIFACFFRIKLLVLEWNALSSVLYFQLQMSHEASYLWPFLPGLYLKKSLRTLLTAISSELMMPSLAAAFCLQRNTASQYEPADSYYLCSY